MTGDAKIKSVNPSTETELARFDPLSDQQIEEKIAHAEARFDAYRKTPFKERAGWMKSAADLLDEDKDKWARLLTSEMGKTRQAAEAEVEKCAWVCRYYADNAEDFLSDRTIETDARSSFARYLPIGPVLAVMPWNFPFWQVFRFAAPALMAGNVALLKHASNVPQSALAIEEIFCRAGFPDYAFQTLLIGSQKVAGILEDDRVRAATLTGSEPAGRAVAAKAGEHIKKVVLELGGSDPFIVMPSADLEASVEAAVAGRTLNNGQSCIAAKRFIVHRDVYNRFRDLMVAAFEDLAVGDPMDDQTDIGPLALAQIRDEVDDLVSRSVDAGARRLCGGTKIEGHGYFYQPGVIENIPDSAPMFQEEVFGPVAALYKVDDLDEAIKLGNATRFGLGSAIFTHDESDIDKAVNGLDAGATFVNSIVASDPRLPFGGVKASGHGRELAQDGIREFTNIKSVSIAA